MNYLYLEAIHHALPDAKLLWMRRGPIDSCFAMYRSLFGQAYPFSYDFDDLARYYAAYDGLMTHWQACLGAHLNPVRYEKLVARPDVISAAVAAHCGLPWDASALHIEHNAGASFTVSASQVRRPIYTASVGRWKRYGKHLEPLASRLAELGVATESYTRNSHLHPSGRNHNSDLQSMQNTQAISPGTRRWIDHTMVWVNT